MSHFKKKAIEFSICGYIVEALSKAPIPYASISTEENSLGVLTDDKGYFELSNLTSSTILNISYFGFKNKVLPALQFKKAKECQSVSLYEATEVLNEVMITNYLAEGMQKKKDGTIQISPRKLGILPGLTEPDIFKSLQLLPGVQSSNESASVLHIRGGTLTIICFSRWDYTV